MRTSILLFTISLLIGACAKEVKPNSGEKLFSSMEMPEPSPAGQGVMGHTGEKATYEIVNGKVRVNNTICTISGSRMKQESLGEFTVEVPYSGKDPRYRGKTMVFNVCCQMCAKSFPTKWSEDSEKILRFHGLL